MEWVDARSLQLIEEYKSRPCLWDNNHQDFKLLNVKHEAWQSLADSFQVDVTEIKKKIASLQASLRRERAKERRVQEETLGKQYKSTWFAYNSMKFLLDKYKERDATNARVKEEVSESLCEVTFSEDNMVVTGQVEYSLEEPPEDDSPAAKRSRTLDPLRPTEPPEDDSPAAKWSRTLDPLRPMNSRNQFEESFGKAQNGRGSGEPNILPGVKSSTDIFGEYVAAKLKGYSELTKNMVQHKINNLLYEADIGMYNNIDLVQCMPDQS